MFNNTFPKDGAISQLVKSYGPEENIFKQGKRGETMFIIVEGYVRVLYESDTNKHLIGIAGPGEVIGEKAILKDYTRNFSVYASTHVTLLEVTAKTLGMVLANWPDFYTRVLRLIEERLDKANELIGILQNPSSIDRICGYILYFQKHLCGKLPKGMYATFSLEEIILAANVPREIAEDAMQDLSAKKIVSPVADGYILSNEKELRQRIPELREKIAA